VYSNSQQHVWVIEANGAVTYSWPVSGRTGTPPFGTYSIQRRLNPDYSGSLRLPYFQGFLRGSSGLWFGFHGIPLEPNGTPIEPDSELGTPRSHGCVRLSQADAAILWNWATVGTTVVAIQ
jgi:lipoprotein-anchoring transpeptidase ErfK/SrfK